MKPILLMAAGLFCISPIVAETLPVVPLPKSVVRGTGSCVLIPGRAAISLAGVADADEALLRAELVQAIGTPGRSRAKPPGGASVREILCGIPSRDSVLARAVAHHFRWPEERIGEEGYLLAVDSVQLLIAANTPRGLFYGIQTLKQLVRASRASGELPALRIVDWPDFRTRAVMDDISRGPVPSTEFFQKQIRRLAELKINMVTYYTEHVVRTERHWEFAPAGGGLTIAEWRELSRFARKHYVTLVGNFQSFGHFQQILSHPRYAPLGESGSIISPVNEESYAFLRDVYEEMVPAFDAPFFCVCGDETFDLGKGASKKLVDSIGYARVYAGHIQRIDSVLRRLGDRTMIWGDIALQHPEILKLLPRDALITTWTYDPMDSYAKFIDPIAAAGFEFFVGPGVLNSSRSMPEYRGTFANIRGFTRDGKERGAVGVLTCVWDDGGSALFSRDWYGVAYGADQSWNNSPGDTTFDGRHDQGLYGDPTRTLTSGIGRLQEIAEIPATDAMTERVFWQSLIPARGEKGIIDLAGWDRVLEVVGEAEPLLRAVPRRGYGDDADAFLLTVAQYRNAASTRVALVEAARRYRQACLIQRADRPGARRLVREAVALTDTLIAGVRRCRDLYRQLWLRENRPYALDRILDRFDAQVAELRDTRRRLNGALALAEKNESLPVPGEVRLWIEEATGAYLREWLVCGPIAGADLTTDALQAMGGETHAHPAVTQEFVFKGVTYRWRRLASQDPSRVDLSKISESAGVVYAYATIESGLERTIQAVCGSSGGIQVALNGSTVYRSEGPRPYSADTDSFSLPLARGTNHVLLKIDKPAGDAAFSLKLEKTPLRNRKNRYRVDE